MPFATSPFCPHHVVKRLHATCLYATNSSITESDISKICTCSVCVRSFELPRTPYMYSCISSYSLGARWLGVHAVQISCPMYYAQQEVLVLSLRHMYSCKPSYSPWARWFKWPWKRITPKCIACCCML